MTTDDKFKEDTTAALGGIVGVAVAASKAVLAWDLISKTNGTDIEMLKVVMDAPMKELSRATKTATESTMKILMNAPAKAEPVLAGAN
jgi:hypothetical protein